MNSSISIDKNKCIGCSLCVNDCPGGYINVKDGKADMNRSHCIECGHCYAICPVGAVKMNNYSEYDETPVISIEEFGAERLLTAMKSRRTIRQFLDKPVEQEKIDMILEAGRYCQSASNAQAVAYTILGSKQEEIEKECVRIFRKGVKAGSYFKESLRGQVIDDNFFFKGAPLVIVVSGKSSMDRGLATSYMELMADSLGLGMLISGFTEICLNASPKLRKMINLPRGHKIFQVAVIGYPSVSYKRIPPRKPLKVKTL